MDAAGNVAKASELRAFIVTITPRCDVFRLTLRDFAANGDGKEA
jgi:hypothetical protein